MAATMSRILVVDDEAPQVQALCQTLQGQGYESMGFTSGEAALAELRRTKCDLLLADLMMPGMDGIALLQAAQKIDADLVGVIMTGSGTIVSAIQAMKAGALDYVLKPFNVSMIISVIERALAVRRLRIENADLERRIRQRSLELEAANRELEAFSYSVAHDLRTPLTAIFGFADALADDYATQGTDVAQENIEGIVAAAERMQRITDGFLRLARFSYQPLSKQRVDTAALIHGVVDELRRAHGVSVRVMDLPDCVGDQALLRQVFANLLSNAVKFTNLRPEPLILVSGRVEGEELVYSVRDNGVGFDASQAEQLFSAFQRFHDWDRYEGTGIGLSIAARVVHRHGGRIWARSQPDRGATFYFSLPSALPEAEVKNASASRDLQVERRCSKRG